jgi:hypothetical protein
MATPIADMPVEVTPGDLETRYLEHADGTVENAAAGEVYHWPAGHTATSTGGAVFLEVGPVSPMRDFHDHALRLFG